MKTSPSHTPPRRLLSKTASALRSTCDFKSGSTLRASTPAILAPLVAVLLAAVLVSASGCGGKKEDPVLRLSAAEALETGKALLAEGKFYKAGRHLTHAFEVEPNSRGGREALLLAADALYLDGGFDNFIKCEAKYRDFLNRFPTSERADYAQFKVADCLASRTERPDRDQKVTHSALDAFEEVLRLYPTSQYATDARQKTRELTDQLAAHELVIGVFYNRYAKRGICQAAISRLEGLEAEYPLFTRMDEALYNLVIAYDRCNRHTEATETIDKLARRYPESEFLDDVVEWRQKLGPLPEAPAATADSGDSADGEPADDSEEAEG